MPKSYSSPPLTWKVESTGLGCSTPPIVILATILARLWWLVPLALLWLLRSWGVAWAFGLLATIFFAALYRIFVTGLLNMSAMIVLLAVPLPWPGPPSGESPHRPFPRPRLRSFLLSFSLSIYLTAILATSVTTVAIIRPSGSWASSTAYAAVLTFTSAIVHHLLNSQRSVAGKERALALFWRFDTDAAVTVKDHLTEVLTAYGRVNVIDDSSRGILREARDNILEFAPVGYIDRLDSTDNWQKLVRGTIKNIDIAVVDVTDLGYWVAWEILECLDSEQPPAIVLIGRIDFLLNQHELADQLRDSFQLHVDEGKAAAAISRLEPPLPYSTDLSNLIFKWRFFRRLQRIGQATLKC